MTPRHTTNTESMAAIARHPLHPFLVAFPIAFLIGGFLADLMLWRTSDDFWRRSGFYLLAAGFTMGLFAAVTGLIDFLSIRRARSLMIGWIHFIGNVLALLTTAINLWLRFRPPSIAIVPTGLILSFSVVLILAVTGWLGGELAFRHHLGMIRHRVDHP